MTKMDWGTKHGRNYLIHVGYAGPTRSTSWEVIWIKTADGYPTEIQFSPKIAHYAPRIYRKDKSHDEIVAEYDAELDQELFYD